jgi:hypothetical protein
MSKTKKEPAKEVALITTYEGACQKLGIPDGIPDVSTFPIKHQASLIAVAKLIIISEALNDGWEPDWNDDEEYKYYPWFYMDKPGFRFGASDCVWSLSGTAGGSRLCFRTRAISDHAGKTFVDLYRDMMVIPKK